MIYLYNKIHFCLRAGELTSGNFQRLRCEKATYRPHTVVQHVREYYVGPWKT
jgi:hypothetical protein